MQDEHTLAGIIRVSPELGAPHDASRTLGEFFENWGEAPAERSIQRLTRRGGGALGGPRQHKLRADLAQIRAELARELVVFLRQPASQ